MIDVDIMIQVYKKEIERLMEENTLLKMHLAQMKKEAKEAEEKEKRIAAKKAKMVANKKESNAKEGIAGKTLLEKSEETK